MIRFFAVMFALTFSATLIAFGVLDGKFSLSEAREPAVAADEWMVVRVRDGDTLLAVPLDGVQVIRLRGASAAEIKEPGGKQAAEALAKELPPGAVIILTDRTSAAHGRMAARVWKDKSDVAFGLIRAGHLTFGPDESRYATPEQRIEYTKAK